MTEVVVSLHAIDPEQTARDAQRAALTGADWIELRLDLWPREASLVPVIRKLHVPVIASCRMPRDGGGFRGSMRDRHALLRHALEAGVAGLDLEGWDEWQPDRSGLKLLIRSWFSFTETPREVVSIRDALLDRGADIARVVTMAHDLADAAPLMHLLASTDQKTEPTIAYAMGRAAASTRILSAALGAPLVYARSDHADETAPGQMPVREVKGLYAVRSLSTQSSIYGVLGNPALDSLGPWLHNRVLRDAGLDAVYLPLETSRPKDVLGMLPLNRLRGLTIASPFKRGIVELCHRLTPEAESAGVVNTVSFEAEGQIVGHNTEIAGVRGALNQAGLDHGNLATRAVVLGSGGAARAAAVALQQMGFSVMVMARSLEPIRSFTQRRQIRLGSLRTALLTEESPQILVHATPVGGDGEARLLSDWSVPRDCTVLDMCYSRTSTPLLEAARTAGARPVSGVEAYLAQTAEQVRWFTGLRPAKSDLRRFLAGAID